MSDLFLVAASPLESKKGGFENAAYQGNHIRQFSQATTASQNGINKGSPNIPEESPKGVGETTYQEWFSKVASKPGVQLHEESSLPSPSAAHAPSRQSLTQGPPYLPYGQDPNGLYGEARIGPPGYYRPY
ncbi:unnamed protein product [Gongylonema pulchrum]|uniref:ZM domain-containing protein n=1 Tax=Gongylonema pulchrum TaxID=637853 RepID=A0A183D9C1_9BILA|nr:unnamed protein product [Gongylonema pulchrum]